MLSITLNATIIRNYLIAAASVVFFCMGAADMFNNPARVAQQEKINTYNRFISVCLISQAHKLVR